MDAAEERKHGAVEQSLQTLRIDRRTRAAKIGIAGDDNAGFGGECGLRRRMQRGACTAGHGAREALREKVPPAPVAQVRHTNAPVRRGSVRSDPVRLRLDFGSAARTGAEGGMAWAVQMKLLKQRELPRDESSATTATHTAISHT